MGVEKQTQAKTTARKIRNEKVALDKIKRKSHMTSVQSGLLKIVLMTCTYTVKQR